MSLWQLESCLIGYWRHHDPKAAGELTRTEEDVLWDMLNSPEPRVNGDGDRR